MTSEEAKLVLSAYRSGDDTPLVRDALRQANRDPELNVWFTDQQAFDRAMSDSLVQAPVPPHLKVLILQDAAMAQPVRSRRSLVRWGLAAALLISGTIFTFIHIHSSRSVDEFRAAMVQDLWQDLGEHVEFTSSDVNEVRQWLRSVGAPSDLALPPAVKDTRIRGVRVVKWSNQKVASICLLGHGKHLHLFVVPHRRTPRQSGHGIAGAFEKCNGWKTVAWSHGDNTYLLSGMSYVAFIKKSRRAGQWTFEG